MNAIFAGVVVNRLLRPLLRWTRLLIIEVWWIIPLWATLALAPTDVLGRVGVLLRAEVSRLWQTRWTWPLMGAVAFGMLTSQTARRLWPEPTRRVQVGLVVAAGLVGLTGFAIAAGLTKVVLILGGTALLGLLTAWVVVVPRRLAPPLPATVLARLSSSERLEATNARLKLQNDLRTTALQAIAGLAVLAGAVLAFQQLTEDRQQAAADRQQAGADRELIRQGQASERFTRAIDQLGSDRREVLLGGIYGLEQIAQQAPDNRLAVTEVLVAYLRRQVPRPAKPITGQPVGLRAPTLDVQAALTVLGRRQPVRDEAALELRRLDLHAADLSGANLSGAYLSRTDLREAHLNGADLSGAYLDRADLSGADLSDADVSRSVCHFANLSGVIFQRADLSEAYLTGADLSGADLSGADLRESDLRDADLRGADLSNAKADQSTKWPVGFDWRRAGINTIR